jgi:tetratricopeptide (TPR) repeat protein
VVKRSSVSIIRLLTGYAAVVVVCLFTTVTALAQVSTQPTPSPTPRRPLPKPVTGSRGFEQYAQRDASARLIAAAGTRVIIDPGDFYSKGEANYKAGKYEEAVKNLSQAVKLSPQWDDPHYVLGLSLTELGKLKEAIEEFKLAVRWAIKDEPKILTLYNIGNSYFDLGQYQEAIESYRQAVKLNEKSSPPPKLSKLHNNLGLAYAASGHLSEAVAEFNQAVQLRPDYAEAHYNLGVAYLQSGKKSDAEKQQRILVKLNPQLASKLDDLIMKS